jgi:hypothetical protein
MSHSRRLLLETLAGHVAWLEEAHPRKAATPKVKRVKRLVLNTLRQCNAQKRLAA